jgi:hypothetical protein
MKQHVIKKTIGRKYAKKQTIQFNDSPEGLAELRKYYESGSFGFHDFSINFIEGIKNSFLSQGFDTSLSIVEFRGKYLESAKDKFKDNSNYVKFTTSDLYIKTDSVSELLTDFILYSERAHIETLPTKHRLEAAFNVGDTYRKILVCSEHGKGQSNIASQPRKPVLNYIIKQLSKKKDHTPQELWGELLGELDATDVKDSGTQHCTFISPDNDKSDKITFKTFSNKISKFRKVSKD